MTRAERVATMRVLAAAGGVLAAVGGAVHGVGEVLQGPGSPGGVFFESWATGRIAENLGGEPGMSLLPDLLLSGLLTLATAAVMAWWSTRRLGHRYGGRVLAALSVLLLLVGGGVGPPVMGLLAALVAGTAGREHPLRRSGGPSGRRLAAVWPALFWLTLAGYAFLALGSLIVGVVLDLAVPSVFVYALLLVLVLTPLTAVAGAAHEARTATRGLTVPA